MKSLIQVFSTLIICLVIASCGKDEASAPNGNALLPGNLSVEFVNMVDSQLLDISGNTNYTNSSGEEYSVYTFKYYITNIRLIKPDSSRYYLPETYWLIDAAKPQSLLNTLSNVAAGKYIGMEFMIGVDSTTLAKGVQGGALDPSNGMVWSWSTGYVFLKMEGRCPLAGTDSLYAYHISGFHDYDETNSLRWSTVYFNGQELQVNKEVNASFQIKTDVQEFFKNPTDWSISDSPNVTLPGRLSTLIADNYKDMFFFLKFN